MMNVTLKNNSETARQEGRRTADVTAIAFGASFLAANSNMAKTQEFSAPTLTA